ncbi:MAG: acetate kinase [Terriglobales bacterium]
MKVLVLNSGSSSQKSCLYEIGDTLSVDPPLCLWEGKVEWVDDRAHYSIKNDRGVSVKDETSVESRPEAVKRLLETLWRGKTQAISGPSHVDVVGHRVVHGGPDHFEPAFVTADVKSAIKAVSAFAPLHNRAELEGMDLVAKLLGPVPQVAVFDTGFHRTMPLAAKTYPGPYEWFEQGIRRYGFHGINHQYCAQRAAQLLGKSLDDLKLVSCHLGNGCSLAAIREGKSVDTTMGFTPLEGLMMGTRSGSVDPGILTYLMRAKKLSGDQLDDVLNKESGLFGISGVSSDMRQVLSARENAHEPAKKARAKLAFDIYIHRLRAGIGAMAAVLGGMNALMFTAGVGENSTEVRAAVCDSLSFLGVHLDTAKNGQSRLEKDTDIAAPDAAVRVLVIHAQEDWMIARQCWTLLKANPRS